MKPTLLFISGLLSNELIWSHQMRHLNNYASIKVISPTQDTPKKMIESILNEAPDQFLLAGHSMGGWLCLEVMRVAKERVNKLCLINTTAKLDSSVKKNKRKEIIQKVENGYFDEVVNELVDVFVFQKHIKSTVEKMFFEVGGQVFIQQEKSMLLRDECESILSTINCPTLVIHAEKDKVFSLEDHQWLAKQIPDAKLAIVEECGHMSPLEKPETVSSLLKSWLLNLEDK